MSIARIPPVYSPLELRSLWSSARATWGRGPDLGAVLCREYDAKRAELLGSGTQALQVAIRMALLEAGESLVALPAFTCFDVGAAAVAVGANIALYDVDPDTLEPDLQSLQATLMAGARVVVVTPLYGYPIDWQCVHRIVSQYGGIVIEDAAQGHGASWRGRKLGSLGALSVLSFGRGKGWTGGSGGALLLRPPFAGSMPSTISAYARDQGLRELISLTAQWGLGRRGWYALPSAIPWLRLGEAYYRPAPPPKAMATSVRACVMATRSLVEGEATIRRGNAEILLRAIAHSSSVRPVFARPDSIGGYLRLAVRASGGVAGLPDPQAARALGVSASYPRTLAELPAVRAHMVRTATRWPGAESLARELVTLPTHSRLTALDRDRIVSLFV